MKPLAIRALLAWFACTTAGLILVDLDFGPRIASLTMDHGLTVSDAGAVTLLVAGWLVPVVAARRRRVAFRMTTPERRMSAAAALAAGAGLITAAVLTPDFAGRKFVVTGLALLVECAAAVTVFARPRTSDRQA